MGKVLFMVFFCSALVQMGIGAVAAFGTGAGGLVDWIVLSTPVGVLILGWVGFVYWLGRGGRHDDLGSTARKGSGSIPDENIKLLCLLMHKWSDGVYEPLDSDSCVLISQCKRCKKKKRIKLLQHKWSEWSYESPCIQISQCERCKKKRTLSQHKWSGVSYEPFNSDSCSQIRQCEICGTKEHTLVEHNWSEMKYNSEYTIGERTCKRCHKEEWEEQILKTMSCPECDGQGGDEHENTYTVPCSCGGLGDGWDQNGTHCSNDCGRTGGMVTVTETVRSSCSHCDGTGSVTRYIWVKHSNEH